MTKHIHHDALVAWANGAEIEFRVENSRWISTATPEWSKHHKYRVKPEPKPDKITYAFVPHISTKYPEGCNSYGFCDLGPLQITNKKTTIDNIKLVFDGETGKLKSVEILAEGSGNV